MRGMLNLVPVLAVAGALFLSPSTSEARPQYLKAFKTEYENVAKENKVNCFVCHEKTDGKLDKKNWNAYGKALGKNLTKKNEKDADALKEALGKAAKMDSEVEGKTFGDLLKDGKLPVELED